MRVGMEEQKGLAEYLKGNAKVKEVLQKKGDLTVIPGGKVHGNISSLMDESRMEELMAFLKSEFDYVIIDTPPMANLIDSAIVASNCDGAIIVVEQGAVSYRLEQKVKSQLDKTGCRVLGVVLNKVDLSQNGYYGRYGKYGKYGKYGRYGKYDKYGAYSPYEKAAE